MIHKTGFRSLEEGEEVEFEYNVSKKGLEAIYVCGPGGSECKGSAKRPLSRKKYRKIRYVASSQVTDSFLDYEKVTGDSWQNRWDDYSI